MFHGLDTPIQIAMFACVACSQMFKFRDPGRCTCGELMMFRIVPHEILAMGGGYDPAIAPLTSRELKALEEEVKLSGYVAQEGASFPGGIYGDFRYTPDDNADTD